MNTQVETILVAVANFLTASCVGTHVERSREVALEREDLPALIIKPKDESSELLANGLSRNELVIELQIHTRGEIADQLADPVAAAAHVALTSDPTLGGKCTRVHYESRSWEFADSDRTGGQLTMHYRITYLTPAGDITRLAV